MSAKNFEKIVFSIAIIWYIITAYFSNGYYHADEHYQIIEFARLKSGANNPSDMPWEFHEKIRSALQPAICFILLKLFNLVSIVNPFTQALILRLLTAIFSLFAIRYFISSCKTTINPKLWKTFYMLSLFIWYLPWINVRFSSETYSGIVFLIALAVVLRDKINIKYCFFIGILLGLSFIFRFQTIALSFGLIMWLLIIKKEKINTVFYISLGFIFIVLVGTVIDFWYYNEWVFTPWNYFQSNIIKGIASNFGTAPWYYYFYYIFRYSFFPLGIIILLSTLFLLFKKPSSIFIWSILPFLILHSLIPHKELRFIFPIINLTPIVLVLTYQEFKTTTSFLSKYGKISINFILIILVSINTICLVVSSTKPAGNGNINIANYIHQNKNCDNSILVTFNNSSPYDPWNGLVAKFYSEKNMSSLALATINENSIKFNTKCVFFILKRKDIKNPLAEIFIRKQNMIKVSESIPEWMRGAIKIYGGFDTENILVLYQSSKIIYK